jgi:hypothetical protein
MHQYLLGRLLASKGQNVVYDTVWFRNGGTDVNGEHLRPFVLLKSFPALDFIEVSKVVGWIYRYCFKYVGGYPEDQSVDWVNFKDPIYMGGYYADPDNLYSSLFKQYFKCAPEGVLDKRNQAIYDSIDVDHSVAVHVRRGDLAGYMIGYGYPVSEDYFGNAIKYMLGIFTQLKFYFFSDDLDYVKNTLIPSIGMDFKYTLVSNTPENGHYDLFLMARCTHQITSKGTLGKYSALLGTNEDKVVIVSKDDNQTGYLQTSPCRIVTL